MARNMSYIQDEESLEGCSGYGLYGMRLSLDNESGHQLLITIPENACTRIIMPLAI